jgi:hypothetical protein
MTHGPQGHLSHNHKLWPIRRPLTRYPLPPPPPVERYPRRNRNLAVEDDGIPPGTPEFILKDTLLPQLVCNYPFTLAN